METIETKPGVIIGFLKPPIMPVETETRERKCLYVNNTILHVFYIGKLSEITEEQAKELVTVAVDDLCFKYNFKTFEEWTEVRENGLEQIECFTYRKKLHSAALSLGIKEKDFDQYLVIKL